MASFACGCAIGCDAGSTAEGDCAWFVAGAARRFALNASSRQPRRSSNAIGLPSTDGSVPHPTLRDMATRRRMSSTGSLLFDVVLCPLGVEPSAAAPRRSLFRSRRLALRSQDRTSGSSNHSGCDGDYVSQKHDPLMDGPPNNLASLFAFRRTSPRAAGSKARSFSKHPPTMS